MQVYSVHRATLAVANAEESLPPLLSLSVCGCMCASGGRKDVSVCVCAACLSMARASVTANLQCWTCNGPFPPFCPRPTRPHTCRCCPGRKSSLSRAKLVTSMRLATHRQVAVSTFKLTFPGIAPPKSLDGCAAFFYSYKCNRWLLF